MKILTFEQWMKNVFGNSRLEFLIKGSDSNYWKVYTKWYSEYAQSKLNQLKQSENNSKKFN